MKKQDTFTVFGYVRVSTDIQIENYSIDEQIERIKAFCAAKGWALLKIYTDGGFSGGSLDRPALQQMLEAIKTTHVDAVVVYKLDRLSRSQKDTLMLIEDEFLSREVDFISINENFDTSTPFGRAMIGILSVFAQLEKDQITERFMMGRIGRGKAGFYHGGGIAPTGYNYADGKLVTDEYQAVQVREIFELFLNGKSLNSLYHHMESKYGGKWSAAKLRKILTNSVYIGKVKFAGKEYTGVHEPLISKKDFETANRLLASDERAQTKTAPQKTPFRAGYLLTSLVFCARCGARYSGNHGYYKCYSRAKSSKRFIMDPSCKNHNWRIEELDAAVVKNVKRLLTNRKLFDSVLTGLKGPKVNKAAIDRRLAGISAQIEKLVDLYQVGALQVESLVSRVNALKAERKVLENLPIGKNDPLDKRKSFEELALKFAEGFDAAPLEARRLLICSLIEKITLDGSEVRINWRI